MIPAEQFISNKHTHSTTSLLKNTCSRILFSLSNWICDWECERESD